MHAPTVNFGVLVFGAFQMIMQFVLLPHDDRYGALTFAERLRKAVAYKKLHADICITISQGISDYQQGNTVDILIKRADEALYSAKINGRNRVEVTPDQITEII